MKKPEQTIKVYLVEDYLHSPGRVYAVFSTRDAAFAFRDRYHPNNASIMARTVLFGHHINESGYIE